MKLVEIRDLDGPNIFLLEPTIKLEVVAESGDQHGSTDLAERLGLVGSDDVPVGELIRQSVIALHERCGVPSPRTVVQTLETPGHLAVAFSWDHRRFAIQLAEAIGEAVGGGDLDDSAVVARLKRLREEIADDDRPVLVRDADRRVRTIAVTGTNGKTTTTRLIAHTLRTQGLHVGWCSSSGVYVDGQEVVQGDYSGPGGARRVLLEPGLDAGILETARGGILLRGIAYESNDVSVFTNVSADHLDLQGVRTVEGLARVKSVVVRVTKADGYAVLNADDPLVMGAATEVRATRVLVSRQAKNDVVRDHVAAGGMALVAAEGQFSLWQDRAARKLVEIADVPITFGGQARHMVENALCAAAACLAFGLTEEQVRAGLTNFENSPELNTGRLNVMKMGNVTVIVDYAHNESGLTYLIDFARLHLGDGGRLITIVGTAGDRTDHSLREIGRIAAVGSDAVIIKGTERYQRGRPVAEMIDLYREGVRAGGKEPAAIETLELPALVRALDEARAGDVIAIMAQEQIPELLEHLKRAT